MRKGTWALAGLLATVLTMGVSLATASSGDITTPSVRVVPPQGQYPAGDEVHVEVWVENVQDLYGADVQLTFDAARLRVVDADPSEPGTQVAPRDDLLSADLVVKKHADNDQGIVWYAVTQLHPSQPVTGTGALFSFAFRTHGAAGEASVDIQSAQLATRGGEPITATAYGAQYTIGEGHRILLPLVVRNR